MISAADTIAFIRLAPFFQRSVYHPRENQIPFPTAYLAGLAAAHGYQPVIVDAWVTRIGTEKIIQRALTHAPGLVVIETSLAEIGMCEELAIRFSRLKVPVLIIGTAYHPAKTIQSRAENGLVRVIHGEPETVFERFLKDRDFNMLAADQPQVVDDLDRLPFIDLSLFPHRHYSVLSVLPPRLLNCRWGFLLSSRGCPHACYYCSPTTRRSFGVVPRSMSLDRIIAELKHQKYHHRRNIIFFSDDMFNYSRDRVLNLCERMLSSGLNLPWGAQCRFDFLDEELIARMRAAGCIGLAGGVESGSPEILRRLGRNPDTQHIRAIARCLHQRNMWLSVYFLLGVPDETAEDIALTARFIDELAPDNLQLAYLTPYPGSSYGDDVNRANPVTNRDLYHYEFQGHDQNRLSAAGSDGMAKELYVRYIFSRKYATRYLRKRLPYALANPVKEIKLIGEVARYLIDI